MGLVLNIARILYDSAEAEVLGKVEASPAAQSVLGRLKSIADKDFATQTTLASVLTKLAAGLPASLVSGRLDQNLGAWLGSVSPTVGQKSMANSVPVTISSDQAAFPVTTAPGPPPPNTLTGLIHGEVVSGGANLVPVRNTTYTQPTAAAQRSIASSSANDTAAGTGARTVRIYYFTSTLDAAMAYEDITLNGTTPVNTVATNIRFIESIVVLTAGSTGGNVGILTLYSATAGGGTVIGTIAVNRRKTFWAHHYVPAGKTLYLASMNGGTKIKEPGQLFGLATNPLTTDTILRQVTPTFVISSAVSSPSLVLTFAVPIAVIAGPARFELWMDASGNDTYFCGFAFTETDT